MGIVKTYHRTERVYLALILGIVSISIFYINLQVKQQNNSFSIL